MSDSRSSSEQRKAEILEAALECYIEFGADAMSIEQIHQRSGASIGSIYHHFGSKQGIQAALYLDLIERYHQYVRASAREAADAEAFVRRVVIAHGSWTVAHPNWARYLIDMRRSEAVTSIRDELRQHNQQFFGELSTRAQQYVDAGLIRRLPLALYEPILLGPTQEFVRLLLSGRYDGDSNAALDMLADAAWRALKA